MRDILLTIFVYMALNYILYAFALLICGEDEYAAALRKGGLGLPLSKRIKILLIYYLCFGWFSIPVAIVSLIERIIKK